MKKIIFLLFISFCLKGQIIQNNGWFKIGNTVGTNTAYIGTNDNRSFGVFTNGVKRAKWDSLGNLNMYTYTLNLGAGSNTFNPGAIMSVLNATGAAISSVYTRTNNSYSQFALGANTATSGTSMFHSSSSYPSSGLYLKNSFWFQTFGETSLFDNATSNSNHVFAIASVEKARITNSIVSISTSFGTNSITTLGSTVVTAGQPTLLCAGDFSAASSGTFNTSLNLKAGTIAGQGIVFRPFTSADNYGCLYWGVTPNATNFSLLGDGSLLQVNSGGGGIYFSFSGSTAMILSSATNLNIIDGVNHQFGTSTGNKLGTATSQKLSFWNATPIIQPVNTTAINDVLVNTGLMASGAATAIINIPLSAKGSTTNDNSTAGYIGEYVSSFVAVGSAVTMTNATAMNITTISLTAGDWDVEGNVNFNEVTASMTARAGGLNTTSATIPVDGSEVYAGSNTAAITELNTCSLPMKRISIASTTTIYLVGRCSFGGAGTVSGFGGITARRVR